MLFNKPVEHELVFAVSLTDEELKPKEKADLFYLLTPEAQRKDELEAFYQRKKAIAPQNIARLLLDEDVLTRLRAEIRAESGYKLDLVELSQILVSCVIRPDVQGDGTERQLKRVQKAARATPKKPAAACGDEVAQP